MQVCSVLYGALRKQTRTPTVLWRHIYNNNDNNNNAFTTITYLVQVLISHTVLG